MICKKQKTHEHQVDLPMEYPDTIIKPHTQRFPSNTDWCTLRTWMETVRALSIQTLFDEPNVCPFVRSSVNQPVQWKCGFVQERRSLWSLYLVL